MKRFIALLLAGIMCLALVACEKTPDIQDDTPSTEETSKDMVELTLDNFDTYFEFVEDPIFTKDSSGNVTHLRFRSYYKLKDEVKIDKEKSNIEITYKHNSCIRDIEVDFANQEYTLGTHIKEKQIIENRVINKISDLTYKDSAILLYQPDAIAKGQKEFTYYDSFELTSVKGTLYFVAE